MILFSSSHGEVANVRSIRKTIYISHMLGTRSLTSVIVGHGQCTRIPLITVDGAQVAHSLNRTSIFDWFVWFSETKEQTS